MIRALLAVLLVAIATARAAEKPTLALINRTSDQAAAELLLGKLAAGGEFALVERDRLAEVVRERLFDEVFALTPPDPEA